jgi:hypothetical protein
MIQWPEINFGPINLWSLPRMSDESDSFYEKLIYQNDDKSYQLRLVVNEFREKYYVHIRKYFLSYESEWIASKEGVSMEASLHNILSLLDGLMEIVSKEEAKEIIYKHFGLNNELNNNTNSSAR